MVLSLRLSEEPFTAKASPTAPATEEGRSIVIVAGYHFDSDEQSLSNSYPEEITTLRPTSKEQYHPAGIRLELSTLVMLLAFVSVCLLAPPSMAQQDNRQLKREQTQPKGAGERRVALVIGNGAYTKAKALPNPANDAADMATALREVGFEVLSGTDLNKRQMVNLIRDFGARQSLGGVGLFYYAGHSLQVGGENYIVPVDAEIPQEDEVAYAAVPLGLVLAKMTTAKNDLNIVILDACRNNPFARGWSGDRDITSNQGLARISPPTGTLVLYATEPGKVAVDRNGRNSLFTGSLLKQIKRPNLEYDPMVRAVSSDVWEQSNKQQLPWKEGNSLRDFYFNLTAVASAAANPLKTEGVKDETIVRKDQAAVEREAWQLVKFRSDPQDFRNFLKEFPAGANANSAKIKLEQAVWDSVKDSRDLTRIQAYLNEFPDGANLPLARIKFRQLEAPAVLPTKTAGDNLDSTAATGARNPGTPSARVERGEEVALKITYYSTTSWVSHKMSVGLVTVSKTAVTFQPSIDVRGFTVSPDKILELTNPVAWRVHMKVAIKNKKGDKEDKKDFDFFNAGATVGRDNGILGNEIECNRCDDSISVLYSLLLMVRGKN